MTATSRTLTLRNHTKVTVAPHGFDSSHPIIAVTHLNRFGAGHIGMTVEEAAEMASTLAELVMVAQAWRGKAA